MQESPVWDVSRRNGDPISFRITVDEPDVRKITDAALSLAKDRTTVAYTSHVELSDNEHVKLASSTLTKTRAHQSGTTSQKQQTARLLLQATNIAWVLTGPSVRHSCIRR